MAILTFCEGTAPHEFVKRPRLLQGFMQQVRKYHKVWPNWSGCRILKWWDGKPLHICNKGYPQMKYSVASGPIQFKAQFMTKVDELYHILYMPLTGCGLNEQRDGNPIMVCNKGYPWANLTVGEQGISSVRTCGQDIHFQSQLPAPFHVHAAETISQADVHE